MASPYRSQMPYAGIDNAAKLITTPISEQEMGAAKKKIWDIVNGGSGFSSLNKYSSAAAKITDLLLEFNSINKKYEHRQGVLELHQTVAAALLSQMAYGEAGTLGAPLFTLKNFVPDYIEDANLLIARFITPADLNKYLDALIRTSASCEDKIDYITTLNQQIKNENKSEFVREKYTENQKILIRAAIGQLQYMTNEEKKGDSAIYKKYVAAVAKEFGFTTGAVDLFVISTDYLNRQLERS